MIAAAGWIFLAISLLSPDKVYQSAGHATLVTCEEAAARMRVARPTFVILPPGLGMICLPAEFLINDHTLAQLPE